MTDTFSDDIQSIVALPRPSGPGWEEITNTQNLIGYPHSLRGWWYLPRNLCVMIALEVVNEGHIKRPKYHLAISSQPNSDVIKRCDNNAARWVLKQFGFKEAREENQMPKDKIRNFWCPVADPNVGRECPCVADETAVVEDKGDYVWRFAGRSINA
jgi:hypothetical protein